MLETSPTLIYLVRHGEVHNPGDILYGRLPRYRLSPLGRAQADCVGRYLAGKPLASIYTSPQLRARQTAAAIAVHQPSVNVRISSLLAEVRTSWQGADGGALGKQFNFYEPLRDPSDETIDDIFHRMRRVIERVRRVFPGRAVACVGHGDPIIIARTGYSGLALEFQNLRRHYPERASVTILTFHGSDRPGVEYVNPCY